MQRRSMVLAGGAIVMLAGAVTAAQAYRWQGFASERRAVTTSDSEVGEFQPPRRDDDDPPRPGRPDDRPERPRAGRGEGDPGRPIASPGGGGMQLTATGKYVYVLRGDELLQFNAVDLEFVKKIKLPPPDRGDRPDRNRPPRDRDDP